VTYEVIKTFRDRLCALKIRQAGTPYFPPTPERAEELVAKGFIRAIGSVEPPAPPPQEMPEPVDETKAEPAGIRHLGGGFWELPDGTRVRGKDNALEALRQLQGGGP